MEFINKDDLMFYITKDTIQKEALNSLGRKLNSNELHLVSKGIKNGLYLDAESILRNIFKNYLGYEKNEFHYNDSLYKIIVEDVQLEAQKIIDRDLSYKEILMTKKLIEWGINTDLDTILDTAILYSIEN